MRNKKPLLSVLLILITLCSCGKQICQLPSQETVFNAENGKYKILVNAEFYEKFPSISLRFSDDQLSLFFETCKQTGEDNQPYSRFLLNLFVLSDVQYKKMMDDEENGTLDGIVPRLIHQNGQNVLVWDGEISLPYLENNPNHDEVIAEYNQVISALHEYCLEKINDDEINPCFSEFFSLK